MVLTSPESSSGEQEVGDREEGRLALHVGLTVWLEVIGKLAAERAHRLQYYINALHLGRNLFLGGFRRSASCTAAVPGRIGHRTHLLARRRRSASKIRHTSFTRCRLARHRHRFAHVAFSTVTPLVHQLIGVTHAVIATYSGRG